MNDLLSGGFAYPCFCTEKRLALLRKESARNRVPNRYDGHCRNLSDSEIQQKIDEGRPYVVRFVLEKDQNIEFEVFRVCQRMSCEQSKVIVYICRFSPQILMESRYFVKRQGMPKVT